MDKNIYIKFVFFIILILSSLSFADMVETDIYEYKLTELEQPFLINNITVYLDDVNSSRVGVKYHINFNDTWTSSDIANNFNAGDNVFMCIGGDTSLVKTFNNFDTDISETLLDKAGERVNKGNNTYRCLNITMTKVYNNWNTLKNIDKYVYVEMDMVRLSSFKIYFGTGSTVFEFNLRSSNIQSNYWYDNFVYNSTNSLVPVENLVAQWKLNNNFTDSVGGNDLTISGTYTNTTGVYGGAINFEDSATGTLASAIDLGTKHTVSVWINPKENDFMTAYQDGSNYFSYFLGGQWYYLVGGTILTSYTHTPTYDTWTYYTLVRNDTNILYYINGVLKSQKTLSSNLPINLTTISPPGFQLNGSMDNMMIFNKALTESEIEAIYKMRNDNSETGSVSHAFCIKDCINETDILGQWNLNNNSNDYYNNHNFTIGSGVTNTTGIYKNAYNFDDTGNSYLRYNTSNGLNFTNAFTINFWYKSNSTNDDCLISRSVASYCFGTSNNQELYLGVFSNSLYLNLANYGVSSKTISLPFSQYRDNQWYMITAQWSGDTSTNGMKIYINDEILAEGTATMSSITNTADYFHVGSPTGYFLNANIDNLIIWERALLDTEIHKLYISGYESHIENATLNNITYSGNSDLVCYLSNISSDYDTNAVNHWKLDGSFTDEIGNNDLTLVSGTYTNITGFYNDGISLDTTSTDLRTSSSITINGATTISFWFNGNDVATTDKLFWMGTSGTNYYTCQIITSQIDCILINSLGDDIPAGTLKVPIISNAWYHAIFLFDDTKGELYLNGELVDSTTGDFSTFTDTNPLVIGNLDLGESQGFDGILDDFRIYNYSLSEYETWELYHGSFNRTSTSYTSGETIDSRTDYGICEFNGTDLDSVTYNFAIFTAPTLTNFNINLYNNSFNTSSEFPTLYFNVTGDQSSYTCNLYIDNINVGINTSVINNTDSFLTSNTSFCAGTFEAYINCTSLTITNTSNIINITIQDNTPPQVIDVKPIDGTEYFVDDIVNISVNLTDCNISLASVNASMLLPNGSIIIIPLTRLGSTDMFNSTYTVLESYGNYSITFIADDGNGNINNSVTTSFIVSIQDLTEWQYCILYGTFKDGTTCAIGRDTGDETVINAINVTDFLFITQLFIVVGIFLAFLYNSIKVGEFFMGNFGSPKERVSKAWKMLGFLYISQLLLYGLGFALSTYESASNTPYVLFAMYESFIILASFMLLVLQAFMYVSKAVENYEIKPYAQPRIKK